MASASLRNQYARPLMRPEPWCRRAAIRAPTLSPNTSELPELLAFDSEWECHCGFCGRVSDCVPWVFQMVSGCVVLAEVCDCGPGGT
eukprot:gene10625-283_t